MGAIMTLKKRLSAAAASHHALVPHRIQGWFVRQMMRRPIVPEISRNIIYEILSIYRQISVT